MGTTGEGKMTNIHDSNDPILNALQKAVLENKVEFGLFFGSTDCRFIRRWHKSTDGEPIKAVGFSPICNTPVLLHDHDEFLNKKIFLDGVTIFKNFVTEIANISLLNC